MLIKKKASFGVLVVLALLIAGLAASSGAMISSSLSSSQNIQHVILIMMENKQYTDVIGQSCCSYENQLANKYASLTNYYPVNVGTTHSLPEYLALTSGSNDGIDTDCVPSSSCETSATNIFSLLQSKGYTWKAYEESMPSNCYKSDYGTNPESPTAALYMAHHNPVPYYTDLSSECSTLDVPLGDVSTGTGNFFNDLNNNQLPNFAFITPNSCNDMHSCSNMSVGDQWLSQLVQDIINSQEFSSSIIFITFDNGPSLSDPLYAVMIGPPNLVNYGQSSAQYNHYSFLATIEHIFNLGNLGSNDATATLMSSIVNMNSPTTTTTSSTQSTTASSNSSQSTTTSSGSLSTSTVTSTSSLSSSTSSLVSIKARSSSLSSSSISSSAASSSGNFGVLHSNPIVGLLSALSPSKDPPVAYGLATYEICLIGALGYIILGVRKREASHTWRW